MSGFTLIELIISMGLMVAGIVFIGQLMLNSIREDQKFSASVINTTALIGFKKIGTELSESAGASVDFLHLPIPYSCSTFTNRPCVRKFDSVDQKFKNATQMPTPVIPATFPSLNNITAVEFFRDEALDSNGQMLAAPVDSTGNIKKLSNYPLILPTTNPEELYATWVLEQAQDVNGQFPTNPNSPIPFMLLRYSKDTRYFALEPSSAKPSPNSTFALFMPSPTLDALAPLSPYSNRPYVIASTEDNSKYFIAETTMPNGTGDIYHCGVSGPSQNCADAWQDANPFGSGTPPTTYPGSATTTPAGNLSSQLVVMKFSPIDPTSLTGYFPPALNNNPITAAPPQATFQRTANFFAFPNRHTSYFDGSSSAKGDAYQYGDASNQNKVNLVQKFADKIKPNNNLVAAPIEISSIYLQRKPPERCVVKTVPATPCSSLMMKTYKSGTIILLDEVSNNGFILVTRRLGKSELSFRIYNQPLASVISLQ